jgi:hypothetical protein
MTTKKKRISPAAAEPTAKTRRKKAVPTDTAPVDGPSQSEPDRDEVAETPTAHIPEVVASDSPTGNGTEAPVQTEVLIETAATTPAVGSPAATVSAANQLSALDAAAKVLGETGQAMNCQELIAAMAAKGYWSSPKGRTPAGTLYSAVLRELQTKGDQARFRKTERGKFALRENV